MQRRTLFLSIIAICLVALALVAIFFIYVYHHADPESLARVDVPGPAVPTSPMIAETLPDGQKSYVNKYYHFSLVYPPDLALTEYAEAGGGRTIVFQENPATNTPISAQKNLNGFQIFIIPYADSELSDARFKMDEPSGIHDDPQNVVIGGVTGTIFYGRNSIMGDTRELWIIHGGFLYEITTYKPLDSWLAGIMSTWKFL